MRSGRSRRILITGCYAPPYGGVSVYVKRLFDYLKIQGFDCHVYDQYSWQTMGCGEKKPAGVHLVKGKWGLLWRILLSQPFDILHINEYPWKQRWALAALARLKGMKSVLTIHSFRDDLSTMSWLNRVAMRRTLRMVDCLVSTGPRELELIKEACPVRHSRVITPFIPPLATEAEVRLPEEIEDFCGSHSYVICANGSNQDFYQGQDIYGLDMLVEACPRLRSQWDAGIVYCMSPSKNAEYIGIIRERIRQLGMEEHFLIYIGDVEFWKVIRRSDVFVRPSRTDSFGISVAESIYLKKPAVASDVCQRPAGTIIFPSGNLDKMIEAIADTLDIINGGGWEAPAGTLEDGAILLEKLYDEMGVGPVDKL